MSHACGHHAQMTAMLGAAIALTCPEVAAELDGQATFFAVPSEEFLSEDIRCGLREKNISTHSGGKAELIYRGCFKDIDMAITTHAHMLPFDDYEDVYKRQPYRHLLRKVRSETALSAPTVL